MNGALNDFTIFSDLARRLDCEPDFTEGRDEMGWLRHLYDRWRERVRTNQAAIPDFESFWNDGWLEIPQCADEYVFLSDFRADPLKHRLATPSGRIELYSSASPVLATMIVRHIRLGWNPLNGSVRYQQRNIRFI